MGERRRSVHKVFITQKWIHIKIIQKVYTHLAVTLKDIKGEQAEFIKRTMRSESPCIGAIRVVVICCTVSYHSQL